ncbi:hypothetical protein HK101_008586 [Irineochytrium annulatum]|nr:hypothetical protein HK101_008586 [Irineochytrium annulatum]
MVLAVEHARSVEEPETGRATVGANQKRRRSSLAGAPGMLGTDGPWWTDASGRTVMLRGVNLGGSAKLPRFPEMPSHVGGRAFFEDRKVSFVGRPFDLADADEHFARLRRWGFNFLRFNVTWESLEHEGPGIYDFEYMDYVVEILKRAKYFGFRVFIDPHQDVWSRYSGGSGAPGWTFRAAGLDVFKFKDTYAALVHNTYDDPKSFPKMIWATNYNKLACATMFTLFFGGKTFAPSCKGPDGSSIQTFLQEHYVNAFAELARRIHASSDVLEDEVVIGYDTLNEPHQGYIGIKNLSVRDPSQDLLNGLTPTPFQSMLLGMGNPCPNVENYRLTSFGPQKVGTVSLTPPPFTTAWLDGSCLWAREGVWDRKSLTLLRPDHFATDPSTGAPIDFLSGFWRPFVQRFTSAIRAVHANAVMFIEPPVNEHPPPWARENGDPVDRIAYAPHWYDGPTLVNKRFNKIFTVDFIGLKRGRYAHPLLSLKFGSRGIRKCFADQIGTLRREGLEYLGQHPCLLGEIGVPFDMDKGRSFRTGDYRNQTHAMDVNLAALEANLMSFTLWNYCAENTHEWGDGWNGEDLSIYSRPAGAGAVRLPSTRKASQSAADGSVDEVKLRRLKLINDNDTVIDIPVLPLRDASPSRSTLTFVTPPTNPDTTMYYDAPSTTSTSSLPRTPPNPPRTITYTVDPTNLASEPYLDTGARALESFSRPFPVLTPGTPLHLSFDPKSSVFSYTFSHPIDPRQPSTGTVVRRKGFPHQRRRSGVLAHAHHDNERGVGASVHRACEVEIYLPPSHFRESDGIEVWVSAGAVKIDWTDRRLRWRCEGFDEDGIWTGLAKGGVVRGGEVEHTIVVRRKGAWREAIEVVGDKRMREIERALEGDEKARGCCVM